MAMNPKVKKLSGRFVKIYPDRGLRQGVWEVEGEKLAGTPLHTYLIKHVDTKEREEIFATHTFRDAECVRVTVNFNRKGTAS